MQSDYSHENPLQSESQEQYDGEDSTSMTISQSIGFHESYNMQRQKCGHLSRELPDTIKFNNKLLQPGTNQLLSQKQSNMPMTSGYQSGVTTVQLPEYEVYNNDIRKVIQEGTVFQSEAFLYITTRQLAARAGDAAVRASANIIGGDLRDSPNKSIGLFEVTQLQTNEKFVIKVYDREEEHNFRNEIEKLELLNSIMNEQGIEHSPIVHMFEAFTCQVSEQEIVHCVVFEHLDISLADFIYGHGS